jgi:hypothetical protein
MLVRRTCSVIGSTAASALTVSPNGGFCRWYHARGWREQGWRRIPGALLCMAMIQIKVDQMQPEVTLSVVTEVTMLSAVTIPRQDDRHDSFKEATQ